MKTTEPRRTRYLLFLLGGSALLLVLLLPWIQRMNAETARIERETQLKLQQAEGLKNTTTEIEKAKQEIDTNPNDVNLRLKIVQLYSAGGFLEEARRQAEVAVGLAPTEIAPLLALADVQQKLRRLNDMWQTYRAILRLDPKEPRAITGLGAFYVSMGWSADAFELLKPAVQAMPEVLPLKVTLAMAYLQKEQYTEAEALLKEIKERQPESLELWIPLVQVYSNRKMYREALALCLEVLAKQPDNIPILIALGDAYYGLNDYKNALDAYQKVLAKNGEDGQMHKKVGLCYQKLERSAEAIRELEIALKSSPGDEMTAHILARFYQAAGRNAEAEALVAKSANVSKESQEYSRVGFLVANKPRDPEAHYQMALVYQREKDMPRALVEAQKVVELKPDHAKAKALIAQLQP